MTVEVNRRNHVLSYVALQHQPQKRKYTGEPYLFHLQNVAEMADGKCDFGYEIGLLHDLLEDTQANAAQLESVLVRFGYNHHEVEYIVKRVIELTDVYTHEDYPQLNRANRKALESKRLHEISYSAQTVKYCDLIDNTSSIVEHDKGFAVKYLQEKKSILAGMKHGNPVMFDKCKRCLRKALLKLTD